MIGEENMTEEQVRAIVREELQRHEEAKRVNICVTSERVGDAMVQRTVTSKNGCVLSDVSLALTR